MAKMVEIICACGCGRKKIVREADVKRGWGRFYSKSCKAKEQERRTHQFAKYKRRQISDEDYNNLEHPFSTDAIGQDQ